MKHRAGEVIREAWGILWKDIQNYWIAGAIFAGYFLIGRFFLYSLCPAVIFFGIPCPACGMTRATLSILKGNFAAAWQLHPFSYAFLFFVIVFIVRRYFLKKEEKGLVKYLIVGILAMILYYVYRMIRYFPGQPPMSYYYGSVLYRIWNMVH